ELRRHARAKRQLLVDVRRREPRRVAGHREPADPVIGVRPDDRYVRDAAVRDPHLGAVQHPVVAVALGEGPHRARIAPAVGLAQPEAADRLAGLELRQPLRLLLVRAERPQAAVAGLDLQLDEPVRDGAEPTDLRQLHPEESQLAELHRELPRGELPELVPVLDLGQDAIDHPPTGEIADLPLLVGQQRVDADQVERVGCLSHAGAPSSTWPKRMPDGVPPPHPSTSARISSSCSPRWGGGMRYVAGVREKLSGFATVSTSGKEATGSSPTSRASANAWSTW